MNLLKELLKICLGVIIVFADFAIDCCNYRNYMIGVYVALNCNFEESNLCYVNLREDVKLDYDTLYIFPYATTVAKVREITKKDYSRWSKNPELQRAAVLSESYLVVLVNNRKIIANWEQTYGSLSSKCEECTILRGQDIYMCTNHVFTICKR